VELTYGVGSHHDLGGGKDCVITAQPLDRDSIELNSVLEKAGKKIASTRMAPARIGIPLDLSFGDVRVQLIPVIKPQT
jgi:hypothetical protein